jgi:hypothetical protein
MAGKKTGAKKTVGKARKGDAIRQVMKLSYIIKENGAYAPKYEPVPQQLPAEETAGETQAAE